MEKNKGMIHIYYGDGKGKTTAAAGLALRVCGCGGRVVFAQFLKDGRSSELAALGRLPQVTLCCQSTAEKLLFTMTEAEREETARRCAQRMEQAFSAAAQADLLVLDELLDLWEPCLVPRERLLALLQQRPAGLEVVLTGHSLPSALAQEAHYITQMENRRHPFETGTPARKGIEY